MNKNDIQRLKESEELHRKMVELANDAILGINPDDGAIMYANKKAEELCRCAREKLVTVKVWDLHPPHEKQLVMDLFNQAVKSGKGYVKELHFLREDATTVTVDVSAVMITYGDKKIIQRICRDVTGRRDMEKKQEELRQYYEHILNMMPVGLGVKKDINTDPSIEFENRKL
ncbi:MAG: PAS domain S-box protein, partial [candidate division Zixibacteria bacterium]